MESLVRHFAAALVAASTLILLAPARAAPYPDHAITLIVPGIAGGAADSMARRVAEQLGKRLNQSIIVEDVGGASGAIAAQRLLRAAPDGYTLMFSTPSEMILSPLSNPDLKYKLTDFTPIGKIFETSMVIVARSELNIRGVDHLVRLARLRPDFLTVGMSGANSFQSLLVAALEQAASIRFVEIPYQGGPALLQDLLGGRIDLAVTTLETALPFAKSGQLTLLASLSDHRLDLLPDLPSISESTTLKSVSMSAWVGLAGPPHMPGWIVDRISDALHQVVADKQFMASAAARGDELSTYMTPAAFGAFLSEEYSRYADLMKRMRR
jgi:tripartite-type tricarboxylate transporter receptor subunit TctC